MNMSTISPITGSRPFFYRYRRDVLGIDEVNARSDMEFGIQRRVGGIHCLTGGRTLGAVKMSHCRLSA